MTEDDAKRFFAQYEASCGKVIPKRQLDIYADWAQTVTLDEAISALMRLEEHAGPQGFQRPPNLSNLRRTVYQLRTTGSVTINTTVRRRVYGSCSICGSCGTHHVIVAGKRGTRGSVRMTGDNRPADEMRIEVVPCTCEAGDDVAEVDTFRMNSETRRTMAKYCGYRFRGSAAAQIRKCKGIPDPIGQTLIKGDITAGRAIATAKVDKPTHSKRETDPMKEIINDSQQEW